jgi:predicted anti-sigma-YlaC factor YlaD
LYVRVLYVEILACLDEPLGFVDSLRLRVHLTMCSNCRNVEQQLAGIEALSARLLSSGLADGDDSGQATSA